MHVHTQVFFDLCDQDGSGKISEKELFNLLKQNMLNSNDVQKLKTTIRQIMRDVDRNGDGELDKDEFMAASQQNYHLRQLLEETIANVRRIDQIIENDLEEPFNPVSANFVNFKEGIHYPTVDHILHALQQIDRIEERTKELKKSQSRFAKKCNVPVYGGMHERAAQDESYDEQ